LELTSYLLRLIEQQRGREILHSDEIDVLSGHGFLEDCGLLDRTDQLNIQCVG
jgi:hypothetical protein